MSSAQKKAIERITAKVVAAPKVDASPFKVVSLAEIFEPLPPVDYIIARFGLERDARPSCWNAYGNLGKTVLMQWIAMHLITGRPLWGQFPIAKCRVLHLNYEQSSRRVRRRYQRIAAALGIAPHTLADGCLGLATFPAIGLDDPTAEQHLRDAIRGYDFVILDSFANSIWSTDENTKEAAKPLNMLAVLSEELSVHFAVIMHDRKSTMGGSPRGQKLRGHSGLYSNIDAQWSLTRESGGATGPFILSQEKDQDGQLPGLRLQIRDVATAEGPKGGLEVAYLGEVTDFDEPATTKAKRAPHTADDDADKVRAIFEAQDGRAIEGLHRLRAMLRAKHGSFSNDRVDAALEVLGGIDTPDAPRPYATITNRPDGRAPRWYLR